MKYGRRIKNGHNGDIQWCELSEEEVRKALLDNVGLNALVFQKCLQAAVAQFSRNTAADQATIELDPNLRRQVLEVAAALLAQCGIKGFVALQEALDEKVHYHKIHALG